MSASPMLLVLTVAAVGVLHTLVPDHWAPIALLARRQGWPASATARAAAGAGLGHTVSTLAIALVVWYGGTIAAQRFGNALTVFSSGALVAFGLWIAFCAWRELRDADHGHEHFGHAHWHVHGAGVPHRHWHDHHAADWHVVDGSLALANAPVSQAPPEHLHDHENRSHSAALLLILGSSPMVEGIPAFFAAARYGWLQLAVMSGVFAVSTIATYVLLTVLSARGLERVSLGRYERYGELISGLFVAAVGAVFFFIS